MASVSPKSHLNREELIQKFFDKKGHVLFLSYCRFWEKHGFVQQSLAQYLVEHGIKVTWLDGQGWRPYRPTVPWHSGLLRVKQLRTLPLRRIPMIDKLSLDLQSKYLLGEIKKAGHPLIWIQGGIDSVLASKLPYIDIFSTFDDPYRTPLDSPLAQKAKLIICQNKVALDYFSQKYPLKTKLLLPPVEMNRGYGGGEPLVLPPGFPTRRMGYVGTFFEKDYDLELFEKFVEKYPDVGFILVGRTDAKGKQYLHYLKRYLNFLYVPWMPRAQVSKVWNSLSVTLLLYKENVTQSGAFPVKVLESLYAGVPCVATRVAKTEDLEGIFLRSNDFEILSDHATKLLYHKPEQLDELYQKFQSQMDPLFHLGKVATFFENQE